MLLLQLTCGCSQGIADSTTAKPEARPAHTNRLAQETSPYLLLHAHNPVDWYPWGDEAFAKAKQENKPIFLSIGYSSCFWCHVMERQVFENEEIAQYMNEHFVNIKVDREERPDLDDYYMLSLQVYFQMAGSSQGGGWPLSLFLTPSGKPIAGGTYFPPNDEGGQLGFATVMRQINGIWHTRQPDVLRTAGIIAQEVERLSQPPLNLGTVEISPSLVEATVQAVSQHYDPEFGGFDFDSKNPDKAKFPSPCKLLFMQAQPPEGPVTKMLDHSLQAMAAGGIRDHLAGGFHRYSTDREWHVPHFEKMLYDNAQLAEVYAEAFLRTSQQKYREIVEDTLDFILRDLGDAHGGFYAALDAETDGIEGKHYVWSKTEITQALPSMDARLCTTLFGLDQPQTFEHGYVLRHVKTPTETADQLGISLNELRTRWKGIRSKLLQIRRERPALLRDDKVLTNWNGLAIRAFARAGQVLQRRDYIQVAEKCALRLLGNSKDPVQGHLLHTARKGKASIPAFLEDYAFLVSGLLALHEATGEDKWLSAARQLTDKQINFFWDQERGGFFFTMPDSDSIISRMKGAYDGVTPAGNSVSVRNLVHLARLTTDDTYRIYAEKTLQTFAPTLSSNPDHLAYFALGLQDYISWFGAPEHQAAAADKLFEGGISTPRKEQMIAVNQADDDQPPGMLIVAFAPTRDEAMKHDKVQATAYLSTDKLTPGGRCQIAVEIDIKEHWHINANPPRPDFVIPTTLTLKDNQHTKLDKVYYPDGSELRIEGIEEAVIVYEGKVFLLAELNVLPETQGEQQLSLELKYQPCDNKNCQRPMKLILTGTLTVAAAGEKAKPINSELFKKLNAALKK